MFNDYNQSLDDILYKKGILLSNEQRLALDRLVTAVSIFCNDLQEIVSGFFQEQLKPYLEEMKDSIKNNNKKITIKYKIVKLIKANSYCRINKPIRICCRSNC